MKNEIKTQRLELRRFMECDWLDLYEYLSDEDVVRYEPYDIFSKEDCKIETRKRANSDAYWAVCLKEENKKVIGNLLLEKHSYNSWRVKYVFNQKYHHNGYALEAMKALISYAFTECLARRLVGYCITENEPSWRILEKLNFRREGHLVENVYFRLDENHQPVWQDTYEYALLAGEWNAQAE